MSQQDFMEFLFFSFTVWIIVFCLVILFIQIKYNPDECFLVEPIAKIFLKIYFCFCILAIIVFNIFLVAHILLVCAIFL